MSDATYVYSACYFHGSYAFLWALVQSVNNILLLVDVLDDWTTSIQYKLFGGTSYQVWLAEFWLLLRQGHATRACSFIFVLNSFPVVVQVMYDASGVRLQAGRQAEVCISTLLSYHTILSLLASAAAIRDLIVLIDHFMLCGRFCFIHWRPYCGSFCPEFIVHVFVSFRLHLHTGFKLRVFVSFLECVDPCRCCSQEMFLHSWQK